MLLPERLILKLKLQLWEVPAELIGQLPRLLLKLVANDLRRASLE